MLCSLQIYVRSKKLKTSDSIHDESSKIWMPTLTEQKNHKKIKLKALRSAAISNVSQENKKKAEISLVH